MNFLEIGRLLKANKDNAWYSTCGHETFSNYVESLGLRKSNAYKIMAIYEFQTSGKLTQEQILEIGISKTDELVSFKGELTPEIIEVAKHAPVRDFREHLGKAVVENDAESAIICTNCGYKLIGAQWKRK